MKLFDNTLTNLEHALDARLLRQNVLNSNLANANTPSYQPKEVNFEAAMAEAEASSGSGSSDVGAAHISVEGDVHTVRSVGPAVIDEPGSHGGLDGNGVDSDRTMVALAQNGLQYGAVAKAAGKKLAILRYVASDGAA